MRTKLHRTYRPSSIAALAAFIVACSGPQKAESTPPAAPTMSQPVATTATATPAPAASASAVEAATPQVNASPLTIPIEPRSGSKLKGTAKFEATNDGVMITLDITSAPPGKLGTHIHQNADCSSKDGKSAGDHFNPLMHEHGLPPAAMRHLGDLGNIEVTQDGHGHLEITVAGANLIPGDQSSFMNRGIIIHEKMDDGGQPLGNAGGRIGCGEIKR